MRLTTKGRFAVTAMIDLALRSQNGPVALAAISQRQQISLSYLEQLFGKLRRHELVESTRGPGGGYSLGRKAEDITVADIIVAVDEPIDATGCGGKENCMGDEAGRCMTHDLWTSLNAKMIEYLWPRASPSRKPRSSAPSPAPRWSNPSRSPRRIPCSHWVRLSPSKPPE
jgi:Rrf2 family iron-sulfur cluster assembly transcriptional regulator